MIVDLVDIQRMWAILHPVEAIENVHLYLPEDADKAIDIGLKFHGKAQDSPRLTLSEGYRNSLGLCIFLAMAKRETDRDLPIFLDDVVVSLDRNHRGMIVELLQKEFSGRQVVILTHDRDWYTELRQQLGGKSWAFKALLPYETPQIGIRWSQRTTTFSSRCGPSEGTPDLPGSTADHGRGTHVHRRAPSDQTALSAWRQERQAHGTRLPGALHWRREVLSEEGRR